jgi:hypothetical protein
MIEVKRDEFKPNNELRDLEAYKRIIRKLRENEKYEKSKNK